MSQTEAERMATFIKEANLVGRTIVAVGYTSDDEVNASGCEQRGAELVLDDGAVIVIYRDDEGNGPGTSVVYRPDTEAAYLPTFRI